MQFVHPDFGSVQIAKASLKVYTKIGNLFRNYLALNLALRPTAPFKGYILNSAALPQAVGEKLEVFVPGFEGLF